MALVNAVFCLLWQGVQCYLKKKKNNIQFGIKLKSALKEMCLQFLFVFFSFHMRKHEYAA